MDAPTIALVTGANRGIGRAAALALADRGAQMILACRDPHSGGAAREAILQAVPGAQVGVEALDLADPASIRALAGRVSAAYPRLDVLVHNAALFSARREITSEGLERMFTTNHLGMFRLTQALLPLLQASPAARVLVITAPSTVPVNFDDLQGEHSFSALRAFGATKMCNLLFAYGLAARLHDTRVTVNAVHPGIVKTDLMRAAPAPLRWLTHLTGTSPQKAGAAIAQLALDEAYARQTGKFYRDGVEIESSAYARDPANQQHLWALSEALG